MQSESDCYSSYCDSYVILMSISVETISPTNKVTSFKLGGQPLFSIQTGGPLGRVVIRKCNATLIWESARSSSEYTKTIQAEPFTYVFESDGRSDINTIVTYLGDVDVRVQEEEQAGGFHLSMHASQWSIWADCRKSHIFDLVKDEWLHSKLGAIPSYGLDDNVDYDLIYALQDEIQARYR